MAYNYYVATRTKSAKVIAGLSLKSLASVKVGTYRDLPLIPAVYFLFVKGRLAYIGHTNNLQFRWQAHHLRSLLSGSEIRYIPKRSYQQRCFLEAFSILKYKPRFNSQGRGAIADYHRRILAQLSAI